MNKPILEKATFEFSQEQNCMSSEDGEYLTIECMASLGVDREKGCFFILKTEQWSINNIQELESLINRASKAIENETITDLQIYKKQ
jgi:hypothetical protein